MEISITLAKFWAVYMLTFAFIFMFSRKALDRFLSYYNDERFVFITGFLSFIIGLVNILLHDLWVSDWRVLITLFGWIALIKGLIRITFLTGITENIKTLNIKVIKLLLTLVIILGFYLLYEAYSDYL